MVFVTNPRRDAPAAVHLPRCLELGRALLGHLRRAPGRCLGSRGCVRTAGRKRGLAMAL